MSKIESIKLIKHYIKSLNELYDSFKNELISDFEFYKSGIDIYDHLSRNLKLMTIYYADGEYLKNEFNSLSRQYSLLTQLLLNRFDKAFNLELEK